MADGDTGFSDDSWLARDPLPEEPMATVAQWLDEAWADGRQRNPHAIALATADAEGRPSVRMVLCNELDTRRGALVFYTHRPSRKGRDLEARPWASAVFHWHAAGRQVRVDGPVERLDDAASDRYFATRPLDARLGAWASRQSETIASRSALEERIADEARRLGLSWPLEEEDASTTSIPRPPHWGGYRLVAQQVELWVSRPARIHDRAVWSRSLGQASAPRPADAWDVTRLQP